jgi:pimeloyl-[acyl-carrier protein] methyl ester esterase
MGEEGEAAATIVLLPGMDGSGLLFADFINALAPRVEAKVVAYPPDRPLTYPQLAALVRTELPNDRPFILLGESFSGPIAVTLAASQPPGLRALVLVCSFVRSPARLPLVLQRWLAALPVRMVPIRLAAAILLGRFATARLRELLGQAVHAVAPEVWRTRLAAVVSVNVEQELRRIGVPVLYLRARQDRVVPRFASELISRCLPSVRIVDLESPHFMLQAKPAESAAHIQRLLRELT